MTTITAAVVKDGVLHPTLDAIAAGDHERCLIYSPETPQVDSLVECWQHLGRYIAAVAVANGAQLACERAVAAFADQLARDLRAAELAGESQAPSNKQLAAELRGPLDVLADPLRMEEHPAAAKALHKLFASTPRAQLFRRALAHELGITRMAKLADAHRRWEQSRARRARKAGAR